MLVITLFDHTDEYSSLIRKVFKINNRLCSNGLCRNRLILLCSRFSQLIRAEVSSNYSTNADFFVVVLILN